MTETTILWLFGTVIGLQTTVIGAMIFAAIQHSRECNQRDSRMSGFMADMRAKLDRVERDIGTHETGLRGQLHRLASEMTPIAVWAQMEQGRREEQRRREWIDARDDAKRDK